MDRPNRDILTMSLPHLKFCLIIRKILEIKYNKKIDNFINLQVLRLFVNYYNKRVRLLIFKSKNLRDQERYETSESSH